mmetsp:Transcript_96591/g.306470  ORF Transcript_96591/g.306470 Transcript_96591/m.306470 type:complete len:370 (-) Transcript_96591:1110-2219(-)
MASAITRRPSRPASCGSGAAPASGDLQARGGGQRRRPLHLRRTSQVLPAVQPPHQELQFPVHGPRLLQDRDHVDASGHPPQALAAHDEALDAHLVVCLPIQDVKQLPGVEGIELLGREVRLHAVVLQVALELFPTDRPGFVCISFLENALHLDEEGLVALQLGLNHKILIQPAELASAFDEDAREDVENADHDKYHVEAEEPTVDHRDTLQWLGNIDPSDSVHNGGEQGVHRVDHRVVPLHYTVYDNRLGQFIVLVLALEVQDRSLHEDDGEKVHDDQEQEQRPGQRAEGLHDGADHQPQVAEVAHDSDNAEDPEHPNPAHDSEGAHAHAHVLHDLLGERHHDQPRVEGVPLRVRARQPLSTIGKNTKA